MLIGWFIFFLFCTIFIYFCNRELNPTDNTTSIIKGSNISIWMDETNQQIAMTLKAKLILALENIGPALKKQGTSIY